MFPRELAFFIARSRFPDGHDWLRTNSKLANGIAVILQLIQRVLPGAVRGNAASPVPAHLGAENAEAVLGIVVGDALDKARQNFLSFMTVSSQSPSG